MGALALLVAAGAILWWVSATRPFVPGLSGSRLSPSLANQATHPTGSARTAIAFTALAIAAVAGTTFPDIDQILPLGGHRSAISHSLLPGLLCLHRRLRPLAFGLGFGLALHLSADLFPQAMRGFALIKVPGVGSLGRDGSRIWLAVNVIGGFALATGAGTIIRARAARLAATGAAAVFAIAYLAGVPGGWWAIASFAAIGWAVWQYRR